MRTEALSSSANNVHGYETVLRISKALTAYRDPEELARILADELGEFLPFNHLDVVIFQENSTEIEWLAWGKGRLPLPNLPAEELLSWHVYNSQEPLHIANWSSDERFPSLKRFAATNGVEIGSVVRVPLMAPPRRLGTLGIAGRPGITYSAEDISFLQMIARIVAFVIDDRLNLSRAQTARAELQRQNERLQLLLNMTNRITSNLKLREVLRAISSNIREVMQCDAVIVSLEDPGSGKTRLYALDFPHGKGFVREEQYITPSRAAQQAFDTLRPVVISTVTRDALRSTAYELTSAEGIKSLALIPIVNRGRALGVLGIGRTTEGPFPAQDLDFLFFQVSGQIAIAIENALAYREISELKDKLAQEKLYLEQEIRSEMNFDQIIGNSPALKHVLELVETVAPNDSTVLVLGETGTGKELIARAIHDHSRRKDRTFVKLNCAAIPTGLLESELFGHEKGAFTGAVTQKIGRLELADQGTLFLDEVGDIPIEIQPKLLRALQEREFERLGSTHTRKVNFRLVAATNRDLEKMVANREFRNDLFYRLNVFPIRMPPLRDRKEDIPLLVSYFVQKLAKQMQKNIEMIPSAVMKGLTDWHWPGNIRELENFSERAVILTRGKALQAPLGELQRANAEEPLLHRVLQQPRLVIGKDNSSRTDANAVAEEFAKRQREEIIRALTECKGRVGGADGAATRLRINRTTLLSRMRRYGIYAKQYAG